MQRLARVGSGGEDRVVAEQPGVAVGGTLLQAPADLADETVDVDHQPPVTRAGAGLPRALKRLPEELVELAHVPERERAQKRPQRRRRRDPATQQPARPARAQHARVVDAVGAQDHRVEDRHHLAAHIRRARPVTTQPHQTSCQRLDTEPLRDRRDQRDPGI